jgi:hypothetical protein
MATPRSQFLALIGQQVGEPGRALKYDPGHCNTIRLLAQRGEFPEAWAAEIGVTLNTMRNWARAHPEFAEAVVIAHHLLQTFWTRDIVKNRLNKDARPGLYGMIARRLPALYGRNPVDLAAWLVDPEALPVAAPQPIAGIAAPNGAEAMPTAGAEAVKAMKTEDIEAKLRELRRRREAEEGSG